MAEEFVVINTQEEFDARVTKLYGDVKGLHGQVTTLTGENETHKKTIADLQGQVKGFQTSALKQRIAREKGIPAEMADRLSGENEADITKDADSMAAIFKAARGTAPLYQPGNEGGNNEEKAAMTKLLNSLKGD